MLKEGHTEASRSSEIMQPIFVKENYADRRKTGVNPHLTCPMEPLTMQLGGFSASEHHRRNPDPGWE